MIFACRVGVFMSFDDEDKIKTTAIYWENRRVIIIFAQEYREFHCYNNWTYMKRLDTYSARPFVKWVGGKTQLLDDIRKALPCDLSDRKAVTYVEPFGGGGAVLFWILQEYDIITRAIINGIY